MDLDRLIATEQRLDERLRRAQEEAARLVAEAREAARRREAELAAELETAALQFATEAAAERQRREQEVRAEAAARVRRFEAVTDEAVARAAQEVVERLVATDAGEAAA